MSPYPAYFAAGLALLIFVVNGLLIMVGWNRGYSDPAIYEQATIILVVTGAILLVSLIMAFLAWRRARAPLLLMLAVLAGAGAALVAAARMLLLDPGDAFWTVPPLLGFAVCSVWSLLNAVRVRGD